MCSGFAFRVFTGKNLDLLGRMAFLAQLGAHFLVRASLGALEWLGTEAGTLRAAAHAWHVSAWRC